MSDSLHVEKIYLRNTFIIKELEFNPDGVAVIQGDNATGKTSVLRAIQQMYEGGHDPDLLRKGAESADIVFEFENGIVLEARSTKSGTRYEIKNDPEGRTAREFINSLHDQLAVNPIEIVQARSKDRGQILLEAMPIKIGPEDVRDILAPAPDHQVEVLSDFDFDQHALEALGDEKDGLIGYFYDERQALFGSLRDKEGTLEELDDPGEQDIEAFREEKRGARKTADDLRTQKEQALAEIDEEQDEEIGEINEWEKQKIAEIRSEAKSRRQEVRAEHENQRESIREEYDADIQEAESDAERLEEKIEVAVERQQRHEHIQKVEAEVEDLRTRREAFTEVIEGLRDLRNDVASELPEGVQIHEDGEIYDQEGIPFRNWNEERQIRFAAKVATMRAGPIKLIPIDGIEKIVGKQREAFIEFAKASDAQFVLTEAVPDEDLQITYPE